MKPSAPHENKSGGRGFSIDGSGNELSFPCTVIFRSVPETGSSKIRTSNPAWDGEAESARHPAARGRKTASRLGEKRSMLLIDKEIGETQRIQATVRLEFSIFQKANKKEELT
jgi:hypothetical protein